MTNWKHWKRIAMMAIIILMVAARHGHGVQRTKIKIAFGLKSPKPRLFTVQLLGNSAGLQTGTPVGSRIEKNDRIAPVSALFCGAGDVDELIAEVSFPEPTAPLRKLANFRDPHSINGDAMWGYLMEHGSPGQSARLRKDPWYHPDAPLLTVQLNKEGTSGFTIGLLQLLEQGAMWLPEQDIFITLADNPVSFEEHLASLKGRRILDRVKEAPDASLSQFKKLWEDIGDPIAWNVSWATTWLGIKGHLTVIAPSYGSVYKFAVDRFGNVRPDFASPHKFRLDISYGNCIWKSQHIENGLPVIITRLEKNGQLCEIEQFAAAFGNKEAVMFTKVRISGKAGPISFGIRLKGEPDHQPLRAIKNRGNWTMTDTTGNTWLMLEGTDGLNIVPGETGITVNGELTEGTAKELILKLPSPVVDTTGTLAALTYSTARKATIQYWENWMNKGASFKVPEEAVNNLYRANLWHALSLPRHTTDSTGNRHIDLPYTNIGYGQKDAMWPINQAVYVDYMIYGLRGYEQIAQEEIASMYKTQQQPDGRMAGNANWGVYSPGHLYAVAQNYLLTGNRESFESLLPQSLKTLDWCMAQLAKANKTGLIEQPLNDLTTAKREWAFIQAYFGGGLEAFGKALALYGHPRANEVRAAAAKMKKDVTQEFSRSSVRSPVVQLEDGTWINYVPTDALTPRRIMEEWYPTDVDCGALHMSRLGVIDPHSWLTTALLHDQEDNLLFKNQGAANEPVYVQQGNTYLLRDEPKAVIRSFYSLMACGFSHGQLTPLEHRWAWGQYYGPPSTDGAWFEIYRKMLLNELGGDTLIIGQAVPGEWLQKGKQIEVKNAPSYFGPVSFTITGENDQHQITATVQLAKRNPPKELLVRFRHPGNKQIRSVTVNGKAWMDYDVKKEHIKIPSPEGDKFIVTATY
ncbi:hypothetical protein [Chitinophaga sp. OAE865]|uniref:hypothetical protein n=1 Tax=Chitinophaga sp. OAE865 TaxID=2817898 RepID=UPI001AE360F6